MRRTVLFMAAGFSLALLAACAGTPSDGTTAGTAVETTVTPAAGTTTAAAAGTGTWSAETGQAKTAAEETGMENAKELKNEAISRIVFRYDDFNRFGIDATVTEISRDGAKLEIKKTVGPMNYTGFRKEGTLDLTGPQTAELIDIIGRYDIEGMSRLPRRGSSASPTRTLYVFAGEERYVVSFDTKFPETIPPVEDIMYFELFNFFNGRISGEPGWEEVRSEDLEDPRENPAYGERTVKQFGKEVRLVPGTGVYYEDGAGAKIDYGDRLWWMEEGFLGTWTMTEEDRGENTYRTADDAALTVNADGQVVLTLDGVEWTGELGKDRWYRKEISVGLENQGDRRVFTIWNQDQDSYETLSIRCYPGPVPERQFPPTDVRLSNPVWQSPVPQEVKQGSTEGSWICEECGTENTTKFCTVCGGLSPGTRPAFMKRKQWPEDGHLPTLEEVLAKEETHGPLKEAEWHYYSSGMMMGDVSRYSMKLFRENGEGRLIREEMKAFQPKTVSVYSVGDEVFERLQELTDQENLAAWSFLRVDPEKQMIVLDLSRSETISLTFDDTSAGGFSSELRTIDREAVTQQGEEAEKVWNAAYQILQDCAQPEKLLKTETFPNPYVPSAGNGGGEEGKSGSTKTPAPGAWICPTCGYDENTGKFCSNCGSRRPEV